MVFTQPVSARRSRQHRARRARRRCPFLQAGACGVLALAGRGPARVWACSRRPKARRRLGSRGAHPCLARRSRRWRARSTAVS